MWTISVDHGLCAEQCGSSLEITPILSSRLSTYWAGLGLAWILICNQYVVSCKHLLGAVCFLRSRSCIWLPFSNTHADAAGCGITREKSLWILTKKKRSLSLIVCFDLYAFSGTVIGCKLNFSTKIWDIYVYSYLPCCSRAAVSRQSAVYHFCLIQLLWDRGHDTVGVYPPHICSLWYAVASAPTLCRFQHLAQLSV